MGFFSSGSKLQGQVWNVSTKETHLNLGAWGFYRKLVTRHILLAISHGNWNSGPKQRNQRYIINLDICAKQSWQATKVWFISPKYTQQNNQFISDIENILGYIPRGWLRVNPRHLETFKEWTTRPGCVNSFFTLPNLAMLPCSAIYSPASTKLKCL